MRENVFLRRDEHNSCSYTILSHSTIKEHFPGQKKIYKEGLFSEEVII